MSEVRVTTLKDTSGSNSSTTEQISRGRSRAFVNFNGQGAVSIRRGFNVNSITDHQTADYTVNFSTAFATSNYTAVACCSSINNNNNPMTLSIGSASSGNNMFDSTYSTTAVRMCISRDGVIDHDSPRVCVSVFE